MKTVTKIYKGYKIRLSKRKKGCMSFFGYISLTSSAWNDVYVLNHEIGHERQRAKYGNLKTLFKVYIPSIYGYWFKNLSYTDYYKQPWEAEANKLGGNEYWENGKYYPPLSESEIGEEIRAK